jgi:hypothetical protein
MPHFIDKFFEIRKREFEQFKLSYKLRRDRDFPTGISIDELSVQYDIQDNLIAKIEARVLVERLEPFVIKRCKTVYVRIYQTWWDHFKDTYKDKWWMPKTRIRYNHVARKVDFLVIVRPMRAFPNSTIEYDPRLGDPVRIFELEEYGPLDSEVPNDDL